MAINITETIPMASGIYAVLEDGGSLDSAATYYYRLATGAYSYRTDVCGPVSEEYSFTTSGTYNSARIYWTMPSGYDTSTYGVNLFVRKEGEEYKQRQTPVSGSLNSLVDGTNSDYLLTSTTPAAWVMHSFEAKEDFVGKWPTDVGAYYIDLDTSGSYTLDDIYDAAVSAGVSGIYYDGHIFSFKGSIRVNDACDLTITEQTVVLSKGRFTHASDATGTVTLTYSSFDVSVSDTGYYFLPDDVVTNCKFSTQNYNPAFWNQYGTGGNVYYLQSCFIAGYGDCYDNTQALDVYLRNDVGIWRNMRCIGSYWPAGSDGQPIDMEVYYWLPGSYGSNAHPVLRNTFLGGAYTGYDYYWNDGGGTSTRKCLDCDYTAKGRANNIPTVQFESNTDYSVWTTYNSVILKSADPDGNEVYPITIEIKDNTESLVDIITFDETTQTTTSFSNPGVLTEETKLYLKRAEIRKDPSVYGTRSTVNIKTDLNPLKFIVTSGGKTDFEFTYTLEEATTIPVVMVTVPEAAPEEPEFLPILDDGYTGELSGPLESPSGDDPLGGGEMFIGGGLNADDLKNDIYDIYINEKDVRVPKTTIDGQTVTQEIITMKLSEALNQGLVTQESLTDLRQLSDTVAEKIVEHIITYAEAEGSTEEIIALKDNLSTVNNNLNTFYGAINAWVPVSMDGGAALKVVLTTNLPNLTTELTTNAAEMETYYQYDAPGGPEGQGLRKNIK